MNRLAAELVKGILGEAEVPRREVIGMFGGGFKPPTVGHLEVVQRAINENPELDKLIVLVGSGERDSITQEESLTIWRIYQKYLPTKVEIQPAPEGKAPIAAVYSYARKNPDKDIYWFLGAREGNEEDSMDIIKRTKSLQSGNYPNVTVKKILTGGTVSGTKTRKALLARDKETFIQALPDIPEVDQIWNMLSDTMGINEEKNPIQMGDKFFVKKDAFIYHEGKKKRLKRGKYFTVKEINDNQYSLTDKQGRQFWVGKHEMCDRWDNISLKERVAFTPDFVTQGDVEFIDDFADRKLAPIDVDLTGNHFFDRLNDPRNRPDISVEELEEFFDKLADEKEDFIEFLRKYKDVVVKDTDTNINIPFMKRANKAIAKTIMRKKNFMTSNKVLPLEEGRYDREVTMISNMVINYFKDVFGEKVSETFEDAGELGDDTYNLIVDFIPSDFEKLGPLPFIINAAAGENDMAIQIDYQSTMFPEAYNELIPELKDAIRHELEHLAQYRFDKDAIPTDTDEQDDLPLVDYLTLDYEIPAFVQGIYKKAKTKKIPFTDALDEFLDDRLDELDPEEVSRVRRAYIAYAKKNLPATQINENIDREELKKGIEVEKEHTNDPKIAMKIALDHLGEDPQYYTKLATLGLEENDPKKGTGKKPKGSGRRLYTDEDPSDTVKIKFSTRQDIIDTLGKTSFKSKSHARQSQVINLIHQRVRAAYGRAKKPEVKKRLKTALDYITKRKEASKEKTKRLQAQKKKKKANENVAPNHNQKAAPYGSGYKKLNENYEGQLGSYIESLTDYMGSNGLNLKPYPSLEYIESDKENAANIFGRTAYYMPSEQKIVLYTMGRHPKDILRSYAHELIHHHQNLNGTLDHSQTTNTNEDDALDRIEREAYENGNILFRNWEDSIKNQ